MRFARLPTEYCSHTLDDGDEYEGVFKSQRFTSYACYVLLSIFLQYFDVYYILRVWWLHLRWNVSIWLYFKGTLTLLKIFIYTNWVHSCKFVKIFSNIKKRYRRFLISKSPSNESNFATQHSTYKYERNGASCLHHCCYNLLIWPLISPLYDFWFN